MNTSRPLCFYCCLFLTVAFAARSHAQVSTAHPVRERLDFDDGWHFQKGDPSGVGDSLSYAKIKPWVLPTANAFRLTQPVQRPEGVAPGEKISYVQSEFNDKGWRALTLPHDWGIEGPFEQSLSGETGKRPYFGIGWYRKAFDLPASDRGRQITLAIDGAMSYSVVWCNGHFVGGWPYGYASYRLDLTPYLNPGGRNVLAIRLDNPDHSSRWYPGGGIFRNVWLVKTSPVCIEPWGTAVTASEVSPQSATINFKTQVKNHSPRPVQIRVTAKIFKRPADEQPEGSAVASSAPVALSIPPGANAVASGTMTLIKPNLWNTQSPRMYTMALSVQQGDLTVDRFETGFGVRKAEFTADNGFLLNGKRIPIQGVCLHHDLGALGAAFNTRAAERQLQILKEMGVNAVRTSHNPPAPELLDLCDRMGILVMDEFVDCWKIHKTPNGYNLIFADWAEADVRAYVRRDRNHPCVILWSIGNEIIEQNKSEGPGMAKELTRIVHEEDATRPTTAAVSSANGGYNGFQTGFDVFGYNYKPGEYKKFHQTNPRQPLFGSETASTISTRGEYFFPVNNNKVDFQVNSYDFCAPPWATLPDREFQGQDENPFVAGEFVWTGFDYLGEPTPYNNDSTNLLNYHTPEARAKAEEELKTIGKIRVPSRSSYFGIVDLAGFKKDRFYLYQSRWRAQWPMAHILPHWNWPERMGQPTPVFVYTSGDEAELFLNGVSLGRKQKNKFEYRLRWDDVKYTPGELKVIAYKNGRKWATDIVRTTGPASRLLLTPDRSTIQADSRDLSFVTVTVADKNGLLVPQSKPLLKCSVSGPGEIVATDNGDPTDHTSFQSAKRAAFNGLALVIVRAKPGANRPITLRVNSEGLTGAATTITPRTP